jgi:hypothetical protein
VDCWGQIRETSYVLSILLYEWTHLTSANLISGEVYVDDDVLLHRIEGIKR